MASLDPGQGDRPGAVLADPSDRMSQRSAPAVELRHVVKLFGDVVAVDGIDLTVAQGEFFSLLGPSGSGKTTCSAHDRRLRAAAPRAGSSSTAGTSPPAPLRAGRQHGLPGLRAVPAHDRGGQRRLRPDGARRCPPRSGPTGWPRRCGWSASGVREAQARRAVRGPAPARGPGPGPGQPAERAAARRAAGRARPQAAPADADRAEGDPARGRASPSSTSPTTRRRRSP